YKKNVDDMRESPALRIIEMLQERQADVVYHDPYIPVIPETREHAELAGMASVPLTPDSLREVDIALIVTDHDNVDYSLLSASETLVIDTRNAIRRASLDMDQVFLA
ncbi:MAG: UDP binding domain-containing protein, partial [Geminicoccaceae bacterium]